MNRRKLGTLSLTSAPPAAGYEDTFGALTLTLCRQTNARAGRAIFVDYGDGVPGNGESNDDYVVIDDFCKDHHGVKAWAWRNGKLLGSKYNGRGNNKRVIWDPYRNENNVKTGDYVGLKVCIVDGPSGAPFPGCTEATRRSVDG